MNTEIVSSTDPTAWDRLLSIAGGESKLAYQLRVKPQAVQQWTKKGVPARRIIAAAGVVGFQVTPHELDRALYPHPEDGLPPSHRGLAAIAQLSDVLTLAERATLTNAFLQGPAEAYAAIEQLDLAMEARASLFAAAERASGQRSHSMDRG